LLRRSRDLPLADFRCFPRFSDFFRARPGSFFFFVHPGPNRCSVCAAHGPPPSLALPKEENSSMNMRRRITFFLAAAAALLFIGSLAPPSHAQEEKTTFPDTKHVIGLVGVKHNASGTLTVQNGNLEFVKDQKTTTVPTASITEVLTGKDSERMIGGVIGTLTMFAPYESGRFLSLFRTKIDVLSLTYTDSTGAIHGVVFTLPKGSAFDAKRALVTQGAKTSVSPEAELEAEAKEKEAAKEKAKEKQQ
jgi:hypothetical protein